MTITSQVNILSIPDVTIGVNKTIDLPINLDNTEDVVAIQFMLTLPEGFTLNTSSVVLTERSKNHSVRMKNISDNNYLLSITELK